MWAATLLYWVSIVRTNIAIGDLAGVASVTDEDMSGAALVHLVVVGGGRALIGVHVPAGRGSGNDVTPRKRQVFGQLQKVTAVCLL